MDRAEHLIQLHERNMTRPSIRLVENVCAVNYSGTSHLAFFRKIVKESLPREYIQVGSEFINDTQLEWSQEFDHNSNLLSLPITAFMHPPVEIDS